MSIRKEDKHNFKPILVSTFLEPDFYATTDNSKRTNSRKESNRSQKNKTIDFSNEFNKTSFEIKVNKVAEKKSRESTITKAFNNKNRSNTILNTTTKKLNKIR